MGRKTTGKKKERERKKLAAQEGSVKWRRILFRLTAVVCVPVGLLLALELILRLIGVGYPSQFVLAYKNKQKPCWVENQRFAWRFFPVSMARYPIPFCVSARPQTNRVRILILGESAAQGDPLPAFSFGRILQRLLSNRFPNLKIEVINLAFTAINSHVIRYIAHDSQRLGANIWILYIGNNEVVGPYGAGTVLGWQAPPRWLIQLHQTIISSRLGQTLQTLQRSLMSSRSGRWGGMSMFVRYHVPADDPKLKRIYRCFEANLTDIIQCGKRSGAQVILCTVAVNLKDCAPFGSRHKEGLKATTLNSFDQTLHRARQAYFNGLWEEVVHLCNQLVKIDDRYASVYYLRGRAWGMLGRFKEAKRDLIKARDLDTLRFRADSVINELIRKIGRRTGVELIDVEHELNKLDPWGVSGEESFVDHVHFNFDGNYRVALLLAKRLEKRIRSLTNNATHRPQQWLDRNRCAELLAYSPLYEWTALNLIQKRMLRPPYTFQIDYTQRLDRITRRLKKLEWASKPAGMRQALRKIEQAIELHGDDWRLHEMRARVASGLFDWQTAEKEWIQLAKLLPHSGLPWKELGKLRLERGEPQQAVEAFRAGLKREPWNPEILEGMGRALWQTGAQKSARHFLKAALRLDPSLAEAARLLNKY